MNNKIIIELDPFNPEMEIDEIIDNLLVILNGCFVIHNIYPEKNCDFYKDEINHEMLDALIELFKSKMFITNGKLFSEDKKAKDAIEKATGKSIEEVLK